MMMMMMMMMMIVTHLSWLDLSPQVALTRHRYAEEYNRQAKEYDQRALTIVSSYPAMLSGCNAARSLLGDNIAEQVEQQKLPC
jgi:hypothetical protein